MPRMSKKRKQEWALFLNERNRITYNGLCRKCSSEFSTPTIWCVLSSTPTIYRFTFNLLFYPIILYIFNNVKSSLFLYLYFSVTITYP